MASRLIFKPIFPDLIGEVVSGKEAGLLLKIHSIPC